MRFSILIVDDDESDRYLLKRLIGKTGLDTCIHEKSNGVEALEFLRNHDRSHDEHADDFPPTLCFLDINMPQMNGSQFLLEFSKEREVIGMQSVAIMMFSSSSDVVEQKQFDQYEFVSGYIVKGDATIDRLRDAITSSADVKG